MSEVAICEKGTRIQDRKTNYALLVDGYIRDLFATGMILRRLDYDVYITNSGEDALRLIESTLPDLIITELSLQQMSGLELLIHLKHKAATKKIPIIVHTAVKDPKREEHCRASGCAAFLLKPVDIELLYSAIQKATEDIPRHYVRLRTLLPVRVGGQNMAVGGGIEFISEISEKGIFVRTLNPRPVNAIVPVNIIIHSIGVKVKAMVIRTVNMTPGLFKEPGMALKFVEISDTDRELLRNFIKGQIMHDITIQ